MAITVRPSDGTLDVYATATDWQVDAHHRDLTVLDLSGADPVELAQYPDGQWRNVARTDAPPAPTP